MLILTLFILVVLLGVQTVRLRAAHEDNFADFVIFMLCFMFGVGSGAVAFILLIIELNKHL